MIPVIEVCESEDNPVYEQNLPLYTNKTEWPWHVVASTVPVDFHRPKISIVTPSFNQVIFLEETIRSVPIQYRNRL